MNHTKLLSTLFKRLSKAEGCTVGWNEKLNFWFFICDSSEKLHFGVDMIGLKYEKY